MAAYKQPTFQDRVSASAESKRKALDLLAKRPTVDAEAVAAKQAAREAREAKERERNAAKKAAAEEAKRAKAEAALAAKIPDAPVKPQLTEAEKKAARDARYAARQKRK